MKVFSLLFLILGICQCNSLRNLWIDPDSIWTTSTALLSCIIFLQSGYNDQYCFDHCCYYLDKNGFHMHLSFNSTDERQFFGILHLHRYQFDQFALHCLWFLSTRKTKSLSCKRANFHLKGFVIFSLNVPFSMWALPLRSFFFGRLLFSHFFIFNFSWDVLELFMISGAKNLEK